MTAVVLGALELLLLLFLLLVVISEARFDDFSVTTTRHALL